MAKATNDIEMTTDDDVSDAKSEMSIPETIVPNGDIRSYFMATPHHFFGNFDIFEMVICELLGDSVINHDLIRDWKSAREAMLTVISAQRVCQQWRNDIQQSNRIQRMIGMENWCDEAVWHARQWEQGIWDFDPIFWDLVGDHVRLRPRFAFAICHDIPRDKNVGCSSHDFSFPDHFQDRRMDALLRRKASWRNMQMIIGVGSLDPAIIELLRNERAEYYVPDWNWSATYSAPLWWRQPAQQETSSWYEEMTPRSLVDCFAWSWADIDERRYMFDTLSKTCQALYKDCFQTFADDSMRHLFEYEFYAM